MGSTIEQGRALAFNIDLLGEQIETLKVSWLGRPPSPFHVSHWQGLSATGPEDDVEVPRVRVVVRSSTAKTEECERHVAQLLMRGEHVVAVVAQDSWSSGGGIADWSTADRAGVDQVIWSIPDPAGEEQLIDQQRIRNLHQQSLLYNI